MPHFFAEFSKPDGVLVRWDTRIYLSDFEGDRSEGKCIGAIVAKNPGSAKRASEEDGWGEITLGRDRLLKKVQKILDLAYKKAHVHAPDNAYVQVLNLFYICHKDVNEAKKLLKGVNFDSCIDPAENQQFPFVWFAWGGSSDGIEKYKERFRSRDLYTKAFYLEQRHLKKDKEKDEVKIGVPSKEVTAKHTQGMRTEKVIKHIADLIQRLSQLRAS